MRVYSDRDSHLNGIVIAPLWRRTIAGLIDAMLVFALEVLLLLVAVAIYAAMRAFETGEFELNYSLNELETPAAVVLTLIITPYVLYHSLLLRYWSGHTPGKNFMQVRVLSRRGGNPTILQGLIRSIILPVSAASGFLGYLLFMPSKRLTSLHDWLAGTAVLREEVEHRIIRSAVSPASHAVHP